MNQLEIKAAIYDVLERQAQLQQGIQNLEQEKSRLLQMLADVRKTENQQPPSEKDDTSST